jgi:hypothetical protein
MSVRTISVAVVWLAAAIVLGATAAQAVREGSWGPIWQAGWLPAVAVAALYRPRSRCVRAADRGPAQRDG